MANGTAQACNVYSPWFERRGDNLIATVDLIAINGSSGISIGVYTKAKNTAGDGTQVGSNFNQTTAGRNSATFTGGLNELVRFKFSPGATAGEWILFRMLPIVWFDTAKA